MPCFRPPTCCAGQQEQHSSFAQAHADTYTHASQVHCCIIPGCRLLDPHVPAAESHTALHAVADQAQRDIPGRLPECAAAEPPQAWLRPACWLCGRLSLLPWMAQAPRQLALLACGRLVPKLQEQLQRTPGETAADKFVTAFDLKNACPIVLASLLRVCDIVRHEALSTVMLYTSESCRPGMHQHTALICGSCSKWSPWPRASTAGKLDSQAAHRLRGA